MLNALNPAITANRTPAFGMFKVKLKNDHIYPGSPSYTNFVISMEERAKTFARTLGRVEMTKPDGIPYSFYHVNVVPKGCRKKDITDAKRLEGNLINQLSYPYGTEIPNIERGRLDPLGAATQLQYREIGIKETIEKIAENEKKDINALTALGLIT